MPCQGILQRIAGQWKHWILQLFDYQRIANVQSSSVGRLTVVKPLTADRTNLLNEPVEMCWRWQLPVLRVAATCHICWLMINLATKSTTRSWQITSLGSHASDMLLPQMINLTLNLRMTAFMNKAMCLGVCEAMDLAATHRKEQVDLRSHLALRALRGHPWLNSRDQDVPHVQVPVLRLEVKANTSVVLVYLPTKLGHLMGVGKYYIEYLGSLLIWISPWTFKMARGYAQSLLSLHVNNCVLKYQNMLCASERTWIIKYVICNIYIYTHLWMQPPF